MLTRRSWFVAGCSLASALAILASAPTRSRADVAVSFVHHPPPPIYGPTQCWDTITYSCNVPGPRYFQYWELRMKDWEATEPTVATDAGSEVSILTGYGGASNGSTEDYWNPGRFVNKGVL